MLKRVKRAPAETPTRKHNKKVILPKKAKAKPRAKVAKPIAKATGSNRNGRGATKVVGSLPLKQMEFVAAYLANGFNATGAAKYAGYSKQTAYSQGSRLLKNVKVAAAIAASTKKTLAKQEVTAERVLAELAKLAFSDTRKLFFPDGSLIPICDLDDDTAAFIAGLEVTSSFRNGEVTKVRLADKGLNLERLGRYFKLFTDKVEHSGSVELLSKLTDDELAARLKEHGVGGGSSTEDRAAGAAGRAGGAAEAKEDLDVLSGHGAAKKGTVPKAS